jgi:hydroxymethylpyrimidine/phosphomethylpyrimidine kinase
LGKQPPVRIEWDFNGMEERTPRAITIGSSDPTGVSGVQADLKTFAAFGVHGSAVVTSVITGGTGAASERTLLDPQEVVRQIETAAGRSGADAVKIGAVASGEIAEAVAGKISELGLKPVVVDPSLSLDDDVDAADGSDDSAVAYLKSSLFPMEGLAVVDISECKLITGLPIRNPMGMKAAAKLIRQMGPRWVVVSGSGIDAEDCTDYMFDGKEYLDLPSERVQTPFTRGSGSAYSASITAGLAHQRSVEEAVAIAKMYVTEALSTAYSLENGTGSPRYLYAWWDAGGSRGYGG